MPVERSLSEINTFIALAIQGRDSEKARYWVETGIAAWIKEPKSWSRQDVLQFATVSGRWALQRGDVPLFSDIVRQITSWSVRDGEGALDVLAVFDAWMHRIVKHSRHDAVAPLFDGLIELCADTALYIEWLRRFIPDWRSAAGLACLNPESVTAPALVDGLIRLGLSMDKQETWKICLEGIFQVAGLAVQRHGMKEGFFMILPVAELGRRLLVEELKFGDGPDEDSLRQFVVRTICAGTLQSAEIAARSDVTTSAGDMVVELFQAWLGDPAMETYEKSIKKFCQLILLYWANNRKRTARQWEPRDERLRIPILFTDEEQAKLTFMLQ